MEADGASTSAADRPSPFLAPPAVVPFDFTVVKKSSLGSGGMMLYYACGRLAYRVAAAAETCRRGAKALLDEAGNPLVTVAHHEGEWQAFRGSSSEWGDMIFRAKAICASAHKTEIHVFVPRSNFEDPKPSYRLIGSPFRRSCTIIKGYSIVAQTSLPYKLNKVIYSRRKFRVTVYPGNDHVLIMAMLSTFFLAH